jgi:hypothetical protein
MVRDPEMERKEFTSTRGFVQIYVYHYYGSLG